MERSATALSAEKLAKIPVSDLKEHFAIITRNELWDEIEAHLAAKGIHHILIGMPAVTEIATLLNNKQALQQLGTETAFRCASHTPAAGGAGGPVSPTGGGNAGAPNAGAG